MAQLNDLLVMGQSTLLGPTTISDTLTLKANQYTDSLTSGYALNMQNSNIIGVNSIYTADLADNAQEGIHFYRSSSTVDSLWAKNGVLQFAPNRSLGSHGTSYTVYHTGNLDPQEETDKWIDASGLNQSTYYPITIQLPADGLVRIKLAVQLNSSTKPSWSTHDAGFTSNIDVYIKAGGWGTTDCHYFVTEDTYAFASVKPAYFCGQINQASSAIFYVRGGGKYRFICEWGNAQITLHSTGYQFIYNGSVQVSAQPTTGTPSFFGGTLWSVRATAFNAVSDARLKENFNQFIPKKSILDLPIYKFDFIDGLKNQIGCKAQDLQEICPEIVNTNGNGYLSIQESKIVYLLIDEVKKLKAEIETLKENL